MARIEAALLSAVASCNLGLLTACKAPLPTGVAATQFTPAACPGRLQGQVRIAVSAVPGLLPAGIAPGELLARRVLIAASPAAGAEGARVVGSTLTITVVGGTFGGSVSTVDRRVLPGGTDEPGAALPRVAAPDRAFEVIPGQLRVEPFYASSRLRAQTLTVDVILVPGGIPVTRMVASIPALWTTAGEPLPAAAVQVAVASEERLTGFARGKPRPWGRGSSALLFGSLLLNELPHCL
jgi:hypothetical protein